MTPTPELLLRDAAWLRGLARKLAGPAEQADDLVQDVSLAALQTTSSQPIGRPWLAAVAGNLARLFHRRSQRERQRLLRLALPVAAPSAADLVEQAELQQRAVTAVLELPALHRDVVLMRFLQGLSLEETARRLQLPLETVRTRQRRALAQLRQRLLPADERHVIAGLWITGWMMNTKAVAALAVAAGLGAGAFWVMREPEPPATSPVAVLTPEPAVRAQDPPVGGNSAAPARESAATAERETVATAAAAPRPAVTAATIVVAVRWSDDGVAAAGVPVMCRSEHGFGPIVASDAAGTATFGDLEPGTYLVSTADMNVKTAVVAAGARKAVELRVPRGFAVQGRVVDPDGAPVPFAELVVTDGPSIPSFAFPAGRADAQGQFRVDGMHGDRLLGAQHAQFGTTDFELLRPDSATHELVLTMPRSGVAAVAGRVVDGSGRPIARAYVQLQQGGTVRVVGARYLVPPPAATTSTDADGCFAVATLRPGKRRLFVYAEGLAPHVSNFELAAGERREASVQLLPGATLVCTVRDPKGEVVLGATVTVAGLEYPQHTSTPPSGSGQVRFADLPPGPRKVTAWHQRFARFEREVVIPPQGELALDIELTAGRTVTGRVVDHHNKPLARWSVDLGFGRARVATDVDGRFTLPDAAPAGNSLFVRPSMGMVPFALRVDGVAADDERTLVVTLECAPSARVRGQCFAVDGTPLGGVEVRLFQEHLQLEGSWVTAVDGWFEVGPLPPGPYRVYPVHRDAWFDGVDLELKAHEVRELPSFAGRAQRRR